MAIKSEDIKVTVNYPEELYWQEKIDSTIAKWILEIQIAIYGEEDLRKAYPLWIESIDE